MNAPKPVSMSLMPTEIVQMIVSCNGYLVALTNKNRLFFLPIEFYTCHVFLKKKRIDVNDSNTLILIEDTDVVFNEHVKIENITPCGLSNFTVHYGRLIVVN